jgi:hypothetical protein
LSAPPRGVQVRVGGGAIDPDRRSLTLRTTDDRYVELAAPYLDADHIRHDYATTIHKTQGKTVDRTLTLASDELLRAHGFVAMSRGRHTNHLCMVGTSRPDRSTDHAAAPEPDAPGRGGPAGAPSGTAKVAGHRYRGATPSLTNGSWRAQSNPTIERLPVEGLGC